MTTQANNPTPTTDRLIDTVSPHSTESSVAAENTGYLKRAGNGIVSAGQGAAYCVTWIVGGVIGGIARGGSCVVGGVAHCAKRIGNYAYGNLTGTFQNKYEGYTTVNFADKQGGWFSTKNWYYWAKGAFSGTHDIRSLLNALGLNENEYIGTALSNLCEEDLKALGKFRQKGFESFDTRTQLTALTHAFTKSLGKEDLTLYDYNSKPYQRFEAMVQVTKALIQKRATNEGKTVDEIYDEFRDILYGLNGNEPVIATGFRYTAINLENRTQQKQLVHETLYTTVTGRQSYFGSSNVSAECSSVGENGVVGRTSQSPSISSVSPVTEHDNTAEGAANPATERKESEKSFSQASTVDLNIAVGGTMVNEGAILQTPPTGANTASPNPYLGMSSANNTVSTVDPKSVAFDQIAAGPNEETTASDKSKTSSAAQETADRVNETASDALGSSPREEDSTRPRSSSLSSVDSKTSLELGADCLENITLSTRQFAGARGSSTKPSEDRIPTNHPRENSFFTVHSLIATEGEKTISPEELRYLEIQRNTKQSDVNGLSADDNESELLVLSREQYAALSQSETNFSYPNGRGSVISSWDSSPNNLPETIPSQSNKAEKHAYSKVETPPLPLNRLSKAIRCVDFTPAETVAVDMEPELEEDTVNRGLSPVYITQIFQNKSLPSGQQTPRNSSAVLNAVESVSSETSAPNESVITGSAASSRPVTPIRDETQQAITAAMSTDTVRRHVDGLTQASEEARNAQDTLNSLTRQQPSDTVNVAAAVKQIEKVIEANTQAIAARREVVQLMRSPASVEDKTVDTTQAPIVRIPTIPTIEEAEVLQATRQTTSSAAADNRPSQPKTDLRLFNVKKTELAVPSAVPTRRQLTLQAFSRSESSVKPNSVTSSAKKPASENAALVDTAFASVAKASATSFDLNDFGSDDEGNN